MYEYEKGHTLHNKSGINFLGTGSIVERAGGLLKFPLDLTKLCRFIQQCAVLFRTRDIVIVVNVLLYYSFIDCTRVCVREPCAVVRTSNWLRRASPTKNYTEIRARLNVHRFIAIMTK